MHLEKTPFNNTSTLQKNDFLKKNYGFSMIETAIALALIGICVVGGIHINQQVLHNVQETRYRIASAIAAESLVTSARLNATSLSSGDYDYTLNSDGTSSLSRTTLPTSCLNTFCNGTQTAELDLFLFQEQITHFLGSDVSILIKYTPADPAPTNPADANKFSIRVQWNATEIANGLPPQSCDENCYELTSLICANLGTCL